MSNEVTKQEKQLHIMQHPEVKKKFEEILGQKAIGFITSVMSALASNPKLMEADQNSVYMSAMMAASLDLPINQSLGFAYIVPYFTNGKNVAQFQLGYKGLIQLAQRTGLYQTISVAPIFDLQIVSENPLDGYVFDFTQKGSKIIVGYAGKFKLLNGFEKTLFMTVEELEKHGKEYSQTYKKGGGLWKDKFDSMAQKTVLKQLLGKYGPLSIELERALTADQAVIKDADTLDIEYVDNKEPSAEELAQQKEQQRIADHINNSKTVEQLRQVEPYVKGEQQDLFNQKKQELNAKG